MVFEGKVALITGGAQGAGQAQAREFASRGARVFVADVNEALGRQVAESLGNAARFVRLDVSCEADWARVIQQICGEFGAISILVNNAAVLKAGPIEQMSLEDYLAVVMVNQVGCFLGMRAVIPSMRAEGHGVIINLASSVALEPMAGLVSYVASKWAIRGMSRTAALELGRYGIRVVSLCPANIATPMAMQDEFSAADANGYFSRLPIARQQSPAELARVVAFAASPDAGYMTGCDLVVDGGTTAGHALAG